MRKEEAPPLVTWEGAARATAERLRGAGLDVVQVARAPYLCQRGFGGAPLGPHVLDGAVFVARRRPPPQQPPQSWQQ